jgi:tetratricopeptide (TPR) repeat protein
MIKICKAQASLKFAPVGGLRLILTSFLILSMLAATAFTFCPPTSGFDVAAQGQHVERPTQEARRSPSGRQVAVSTQSQAVFDEVKARLLTVANRRPRPQAERYVWPPPIELDGSPEFNAYACRCYDRPDGSVEVPMRDGKFLPHIVITQGAMSDLIENEPDRLALVMGHEIGHVMLGHVLPTTVSEQAPTLTLQKVFTSEQEHDADVLGMKLALAANYSIKGAREVWSRINSEAFLAKYPGFNYTSFEGVRSDHPAWSDRLALIDREKEALWKAMSAFENGVYLLSFQKYPEAEEAFKRVLDSTGCNQIVGGKPNCRGFPESYDAQANLGYALLMQYLDKLDDKDVARFNVGQLVTGSFYRRPDSLTPQVKGVDAGLWNEAVVELKKALDLNPGATLARANLGVAYLLAPTGRNIPEAVKHLERAAAALQGDKTLTDENRAAVLINYAVALQASDEVDKAGEQLNKATELLKDDMYTALTYNRALMFSRSTDTAKRKDGVSLLIGYLKHESPASLWWMSAYGLYAKLVSEAGQTPDPEAEFKQAWRNERQFRPVTAVEVGPGALITLSDPVSSVRTKLGVAKPIPVVTGTPLVRLIYPERGLEFLATRRVIAIFLRGARAPHLKIQRIGPGAIISTLRIGMTADEVQNLIKEDAVPLQLSNVNDRYDFYPGVGVAVRYDGNDKVDEIAITQSPIDL